MIFYLFCTIGLGGLEVRWHFRSRSLQALQTECALFSSSLLMVISSMNDSPSKHCANACKHEYMTWAPNWMMLGGACNLDHLPTKYLTYSITATLLSSVPVNEHRWKTKLARTNNVGVNVPPLRSLSEGRGVLYLYAIVKDGPDLHTTKNFERT
jgi:hypothetical protein